MTEPVAYLNKYNDKSTNITIFKPIDNTALVSSNKLYTAEQLHPLVKMTQAEFDELEKSLINAQFDYSELKKTIEIVPDMKWFVRSKELNLENNYYYFVGKRPDDYWPTYGYKRAAKHFDTKGEAEKWKNPLTEAVQLPVEDE